MAARLASLEALEGLRQGDPLSSYLFVLGMEVFSVLVEKAAAGGFLSGYKFVGRSGEVKQITHLLFADDTLVFCKDSEEQMLYLCWILVWFEAFSGLRINLEKSVVMSVGTVDNVHLLARELGFKVGALPSTYLGLPLGSRQSSTSIWDGVEDKFCRKLTLWKRQYISKGGRLTLIRSTLSNLPTYLMFLFQLPRGISSRLEKIQMDFLWGSSSSGRKIHLINWKDVCSSKEKGGLGIRNLILMNRDLLGKWAWRFAKKDNSAWKNVISLKYGTEEGGWFTRPPRGTAGAGLWKGLSSETRILK